MNASELNARILNAQEVSTPQRCGNFIFPVADGTVNIFGREQLLRTSTLTQDCPERGKYLEILKGKSHELLSPTQLQDDSTRDDVGAKNDFCSITGDFICRHHVEPRVKLYVPREESFPIPLKYIDVTRNTHTSLDVLLEKTIDDYWNVDGERELSDAWTGFTSFILLNEKPPEGCTWSGWRLTRKQTTSRPDNVQNWIIEKLKLDNVRQLRGIFFIEPDDEEFKHTMRNTRRKLEIPMPAEMPCKTPVNCRGHTCRSIGNARPNMLVVDADEPMRIRSEGVPQRYHEDHINRGMKVEEFILRH